MSEIKSKKEVTVGITGSSGFIGSNLVNYLQECGYNTVPLRRGFPLEIAGKCDIIINLAGASINRRWSKSYKEVLNKSRVETTGRVVEAIKMSKNTKLLISASAVGIYQTNIDRTNTESDAVYGDDFLAELCKNWEKEALKAQVSTRVVIARLGLVMSESGGALIKMILPAKYGIAVTAGEGEQMISWIKLTDLLRAFSHIITNETLFGPVNLTTPNPISNKDLTAIIAKKEKTLINVKMPLCVFRLVMGEASDVITKGQKVIPEKLEKSGFKFSHPIFSL